MLLKSVMKCPGAPLRGSFHAPKVPTKTLVSSVGRVLGRVSREKPSLFFIAKT